MALHGISLKVLETYARTPAQKPPPGLIPNFQDPPRLRWALFTVTVPSLVLSTGFVVMRLYTRHFVLKKVWWDDYLSLLAWVLLVSSTAVFFVLEGHGAGVHQWNLNYLELVETNYWTVIAKAFYILDILILKLSLLFQILRIFAPTRDGIFWGTTGLMVTNIVFYIIEFFLAIVQCSPRERSWNKKIAGTCIGSSNIIYTAAFNVISDIATLVLPLSRIWHLQMSSKKKIGVVLIFSTGLIAVATSVLRLYYSVYVLQTKDKSFYYLILGFCLHSELVASIIVGCMPTTPRFVAEIRAALTKTWSRLHSERSKEYQSSITPKAERSWKYAHDPRNHLGESAIELHDKSLDYLDETRIIAP